MRGVLRPLLDIYGLGSSCRGMDKVQFIATNSSEDCGN